MTTEREVGILCQWFQKMSDRNVCWISSQDIAESEKIQYCVGNWEGCEAFPNADTDDSCDCCG